MFGFRLRISGDVTTAQCQQLLIESSCKKRLLARYAILFAQWLNMSQSYKSWLKLCWHCLGHKGVELPSPAFLSWYFCDRLLEAT